VTTDVGGTREAVIDGVTGRIVSSRSPHHLCRAVLDVLDDPSWSSRAASQAPVFVEERFGLDRMVSKTLEAYGFQ
jgi:glycosyltransferase involved in cell wall biosynthesis